MGNFIFICKILLAFTFLRVKCEEEEDRYPDLSCHPGYNVDDTRRAVGDGRIEFAMEICKRLSTPEKCYKRCVLDLNGILDKDGKQLNSEEQITHSLAGLFINNDDEVPKRVAKRIVQECSALVNKTLNLPCEERTEFYSCVEKATGC